MTIPTLLGQRVILKPMTESIIPLLARWFYDPEILPLVGEVKPLTREAIEQWYTEIAADENSRARLPLPWRTAIV